MTPFPHAPSTVVQRDEFRSRHHDDTCIVHVNRCIVLTSKDEAFLMLAQILERVLDRPDLRMLLADVGLEYPELRKLLGKREFKKVDDIYRSPTRLQSALGLAVGAASVRAKHERCLQLQNSSGKRVRSAAARSEILRLSQQSLSRDPQQTRTQLAKSVLDAAKQDPASALQHKWGRDVRPWAEGSIRNAQRDLINAGELVFPPSQLHNSRGAKKR